MPTTRVVKIAFREPPGTIEPIVENLDLVRRAQNGSAPAIRELYLSHHQQIYRFIWSRVYDPDLAEDLTGEVFVRMLKNLPSYEDRSIPFRAWLYGIARNLVIDHHREKHPRIILPLDNIAGEQAADASPEERTEQTMKFEQMRQMLEQINPDEREVVELRFLAGMSLKETALATQKTIAAVKALQHRGLTSLRSIFQD
jgi:RNA polymerase sigma-70 factor (ECF subfamily)